MIVNGYIKAWTVSANTLYVPVGNEPSDAFRTKAWVVEGGGVLMVLTAQVGTTIRPVVLQCEKSEKLNNCV